MKNYLIPTALLFIMALSSCTKTIDEDLSGNERSLLELRVEGQMGTAIIDRDGSRATATVYILETPGFAYDRVPVKGIVVSNGASASVGIGDVLNFSNPERRARITVTSQSGTHARLVDLSRNLRSVLPRHMAYRRCQTGVQPAGQRRRRRSWTTQLSSGEFGTYGLPGIRRPGDDHARRDFRQRTHRNARPFGKRRRAYGNFWGVYAPATASNPRWT